MLRRSIRYFVVLACVFTLAMPAMAAELQLTGVHLDTCNEQEGGQPDFKRPMGASCYVLRGDVENPGRKAIIDTDVFARILDASGEPVLQNRTRVGSIGDVEPGSQPFALRLTVPAGTPGPFVVKNAKARGFSAPVRTRVADDEDDLLPLERQVAVN
ncbi:MAG: hypothetical protein ACJ0GX_08405 [Parasynechococcus sp.]|jgi:hypothetical protein|uniref:hypothetical protein n=1 Tax=Synechococcales TaxID=1890424 RepID=UPI00005D40B2|nr:hypothetical protein [Synechococcus sp. CC9902]ABB26029.1 conserved hypothetical protein [Synechococcus sp. CC9902]MBL6791843.1 hypothetical protein [Synechococcus sp. BS307-5m-G35]RCL57339.1 MAG: hypothetical protein DBW83_06185 [Synechococcus sp. MED-G69]